VPRALFLQYQNAESLLIWKKRKWKKGKKEEKKHFRVHLDQTSLRLRGVVLHNYGYQQNRKYQSKIAHRS